MILKKTPVFCRGVALAIVLALLGTSVFAQTVRLTPSVSKNVVIQKDTAASAKAKSPAKDAGKQTSPAEPVKPLPAVPPRIEPVENGDWLVFDAPDNTLLVSRSSIRIYKNALDGQDVYHAFVFKRHVPPVQMPKIKQAVATQSLGLSFLCSYEAMMVASEEYLSADLTVARKYRSKDFPLSKEMRAVSSIPGLANVKTFLCQSRDWPMVED